MTQNSQISNPQQKNLNYILCHVRKVINKNEENENEGTDNMKNQEETKMMMPTSNFPNLVISCKEYKQKPH